ncbi:MAG: hypothetical protein J7L53_10660 [Deltaproteobacteria bacterium]|nr:hypothetical protein [Deltaproteobacteria bacterium]
MAILVVSLACFSNAWALIYVEQSGVYLYYPKDENTIASSLKDKIPGMLEFLKERGLNITTPVHVILDSEMDIPMVNVHMTPHREIRIPLRAPGVLEEGYLEPDPWAYFLFKGLCLQGIYGLRSGIPGLAHNVFGEIISPNMVIPPWVEDGICYLLYSIYQSGIVQDPYDMAIFNTSAPPDISKMSNHPGIWPGYYGYKIYGRPFISWLYKTYGWKTILDFIQIHGSGIVPIEIDLKAKKSFGKMWPALLEEFRATLNVPVNKGDGLLITGYWPYPLTYWNVSGIYPGIKKTRFRGRYGYIDDKGFLWISEYDRDGAFKVIQYRKGVARTLDIKHMWDPGPGGIAVTRKGNVPWLVAISSEDSPVPKLGDLSRNISYKLIPAPAGVLQVSGPVRDHLGRIAIAANTGGNWDIWVYDKTWQRITDAPSIEIDPWWAGDTLVFASTISGRFQIHTASMRQLTSSPHAAVLPRGRNYLCLTDKAWEIKEYTPGTEKPLHTISTTDISVPQERAPLKSKAYTPIHSIWPDYVMPNLYIGPSDVQIGLATSGRDVTDRYTISAALRYSSDLDYGSFRIGSTIKAFGLQASRYPLSYDPDLGPKVEESRYEGKVYWMPLDKDWLELSLNGLIFKPLDGGKRDHDIWGAICLDKFYENIAFWGRVEAYSGGMKSLYGGASFLIGKEIYSTFYIQGGKTWNGYIPGHGSYRVGGDIGEGYFTKRPSRLFSLRGFGSNILEAGKAITASSEVYWLLINLQRGYKTLPLFLHKIRLGTFLDAGACSDHMSKDDLLVGAGLELVTSMEIAWGNLSVFKMGLAWPVKQPKYLDEEGPIFIILLGRPL